jgi:glycosyltransferase involved in cell wall biosynthesis
MNLHVMAPFGYTGYGYASKNIILGLHNSNHHVGLTPIGQPHLESENEASIFQKCITQADLIPYDAPCIKIWHQFDLLTRVGSGQYYAFPFFETDKLNQKEIHHLNFADHIFVSSSWASNVLQDNKITKPISVVPLGVDRSIFNENTDNSDKTPNYVFLSIGKWEKRKSHDVLIDCFNKAFGSNDAVELWLVTHNPFLSQQEEASWIDLVDRSPLKNKIRLFPRLNTHAELASLISYSNCGVYISRAEGWNMELLETMSMNKPVIATNYSAHTEYCTSDNSFLIDIDDTTLAIDNKWFFGTSNWANIGSKQYDQIISHMQHCYKNQISTNPGGVHTAQKLSWENTVNTIVGCIPSL